METQIFKYIRNSKGHRRGVILAQVVSTELNLVSIGWSLTHPLDKFDKKIGLAEAAARASSPTSPVPYSLKDEVEYMFERSKRYFKDKAVSVPDFLPPPAPKAPVPPTPPKVYSINAIPRESIKPGDVVTVLRWKDRNDRSWVGDPLKVEAISGPFVSVQCLRNSSLYSNAHKLSFESVDFTDLSPDYVKSLTYR